MDILDTEKLTHQPWLNLFARRYRHHGKEGRWIFASRRADPPVPAHGVDGVIVVPLLLEPDAPPRLVVTREFRVPLGTYEHCFPAGVLDAGETVEEAARRELREEAGLEVVAVTRVSPPTYSSTGVTDECVVIVFVTARTAGDGRQQLEELEDIKVLRLDYEQVCALVESRAPINGRVWPILLMYQQLGRLA